MLIQGARLAIDPAEAESLFDRVLIGQVEVPGGTLEGD